MTYRSATSKNSLMICHWIYTLTTMTTSQPAFGSSLKKSSLNGVKVTAFGTSSIRMITAERLSAMSHICLLHTSRKLNIAVRRTNRPGSSASMPTPEAMERNA